MSITSMKSTAPVSEPVLATQPVTPLAQRWAERQAEADAELSPDRKEKRAATEAAAVPAWVPPPLATSIEGAAVLLAAQPDDAVRAQARVVHAPQPAAVLLPLEATQLTSRAEAEPRVISPLASATPVSAAKPEAITRVGVFPALPPSRAAGEPRTAPPPPGARPPDAVAPTALTRGGVAPAMLLPAGDAAARGSTDSMPPLLAGDAPPGPSGVAVADSRARAPITPGTAALAAGETSPRTAGALAPAAAELPVGGGPAVTMPPSIEKAPVPQMPALPQTGTSPFATSSSTHVSAQAFAPPSPPGMTVTFQTWGQGHQVLARWMPAGVVLTPSSDRMALALTAAAQKGALAEISYMRVEQTDADSERREQRRQQQHDTP